MFRTFNFQVLLSAGHRLGQQLLHPLFHHTWPFLWNLRNLVAHIRGQVRKQEYSLIPITYMVL